MSKPILLFDLDGTLIDSAVGIGRCVAHALERCGHPGLADGELRGWIGPALRLSFGAVLEASQVDAAIAHYHERFEAIGWREHTIYEGIAAVVDALHADGHRLAVVTAKTAPHARRIVAHLPFGDRFEAIVGASEDGRLSHKPELIGAALARLGANANDCIMIGDRHLDIEGARSHGMHSVGVLWGFGGESELRDAGAGFLAKTPLELRERLRF